MNKLKPMQVKLEVVPNIQVVATHLGYFIEKDNTK